MERAYSANEESKAIRASGAMAAGSADPGCSEMFCRSIGHTRHWTLFVQIIGRVRCDIRVVDRILALAMQLDKLTRVTEHFYSGFL